MYWGGGWGVCLLFWSLLFCIVFPLQVVQDFPQMIIHLQKQIKCLVHVKTDSLPSILFVEGDPSQISEHRS